MVEGERFKGTLGRLTVRPGMLEDLGRVAYQAEARHPVRVVVCFGRGHREPWLLATNLNNPARKIVDLYGRRWEIEAVLKDSKNDRYGFLMRGLRLSSPDRWERMLLVFAYAYFFLVMLGAWGESKGLHRRLMANTSRNSTDPFPNTSFWIKLRRCISSHSAGE